METAMEMEDDLSTPDDWSSGIDISQLCRVCANTNEYLIPIFSGEGIEHDLQGKIRKHLPIKVSEEDKLPTQLCYQCASTLIAWHDLVVTCVEAEDKFKSCDKETTEAQAIAESCKAESNVGVPSAAATNPLETGINIVEEQQTVDKIEPVLDNSAVEPGNIIIEGVPSDLRCLAPFKAYHQTQTALRMLEWVNSGRVFCVLCGKMKENHTMLIKHLSLDHTIRCGHCRARFSNREQLSTHITVHDKMQCKRIEVRETLGIYENNPQNVLNAKLQYQRHYVKKKSYNIHNYSNNVKNKSLIQCEICLSTFSRRFDLKRHKLKHHSIEHLSGKENSNIISDSVDIGLVNDKDERADVMSVHNVDGKTNLEDYMNDSDDSVNSADISRHLDVKNENPLQSMDILDQNYSCSWCDLTLRTKQDILIHQKEHQTEQKGKVTHLRSKNDSSNKQFSCSLCQNSYSRSSDLEKHICKKHGGSKIVRRCVDFVDDMDIEIINQAKQDVDGTVVYRCNYCDKNMRTRRGFVRHVRVHTGERPFTCHICGKQYRSNADLTRHLRCVHDGVKNYQCDICGRYFASKGTRNDHRRTHTGEKPYMCHICGKSFPTPNSIYVHRRVHTDYFPHSCSTCDKKFRRKQQLVNHTRTHTGEKPHSCDICGKCFCTRDDVTRHKLTHSNEKPHICSACGIRFGQKRYLSNHMKTNHLTL